MAKPFKYPQIKMLAVGESCAVFADRKALERSVTAYAKRSKRRFVLDRNAVGTLIVTRLPDPEPEAG